MATQLSGYNYVPMRCKPGPFYPVKIKANPNLCEHIETVCSECVESWSIDYEIRFERTAGGRALLAQAQAAGATLESNSFWEVQ
jgi:hypothetical protein